MNNKKNIEGINLDEFLEKIKDETEATLTICKNELHQIVQLENFMIMKKNLKMRKENFLLYIYKKCKMRVKLFIMNY